ncbi:hypothetical protein TNCV_164501 [Trichonephila clavipes]|nr:hypothetical protein TNCV_164501 [Trichonephila clavipes]
MEVCAAILRDANPDHQASTIVMVNFSDIEGQIWCASTPLHKRSFVAPVLDQLNAGRQFVTQWRNGEYEDPAANRSFLARIESRRRDKPEITRDRYWQRAVELIVVGSVISRKSKKNVRHRLKLIWRIPSTHQWYTGTPPGSLPKIKCDRGSQTASARLTSDHLKCLSYDRARKIHPTCKKCCDHPASLDPILCHLIRALNTFITTNCDHCGQVPTNALAVEFWVRILMPLQTRLVERLIEVDSEETQIL